MNEWKWAGQLSSDTGPWMWLVVTHIEYDGTTMIYDFWFYIFLDLVLFSVTEWTGEWMSEWSSEQVREKWIHEWENERVSGQVNEPEWVMVLKRDRRLNEPPHEYWDKQEFLAQRRHTNWIHLSPFAVRETRHSSLRPLALHRSASPQPCSSPPPTYDTNTAPSHNGRDYHDNRNNGSAWDNRVCGTPGQLKYLRDYWVEKKNKQLWVFFFWELLHKDVCYFCPEKSLPVLLFLRRSLKTLHLKENSVCLVT